MKIIFYNIGYGTGINGWIWQYLFKSWRYLWCCADTVQQIGAFLNQEQADVVCLQECDSGSIRTRLKSQVNTLAKESNYCFHKSYLKYGTATLKRFFPIIKHQHNAVLSKKEGISIAHYLENGTKKLMIEHQADGISIFNVHLSLISKNSRQKQLAEISDILGKCNTPFLIGGDFNIRKISELKSFIKVNHLKIIQEEASFPSKKPRKTPDLILGSQSIKVKEAGVIPVQHSDHLPIWVKLANKK